MLRQLLVLVCAVQMALAAPQFVSFKNGKVGVNFGGYHAEAGLGGLLTGNSADGGLSASAGTPWGPQAAAGLNGGLNGRASGGAYAGAQFSPEVGASSVIGGTVGDRGQKGFAGAEAHSSGNIVSKSIGGGAAPSYQQQDHPVEAQTAAPWGSQKEQTNSIQKIKPHKKYAVVRNVEDFNAGATTAHSKQVVKTVYKQVSVPSTSASVPQGHDIGYQPMSTGGYQTGSAGVHVNSGLVGNVLNIPIGILRSLQESLSGIDVNKRVSYTKSVF